MSERLEQLDNISRVRQLTHTESLELEREIRRADGDRLPSKINRALARRGVKRHGAPIQRDPRARRVVAATLERQDWHVHLECGHVTRRRLAELLQSLICTQCPPAGGIGGAEFSKGRP